MASETPSKPRQASVREDEPIEEISSKSDFGASFEGVLIGDGLLAKHVADPEFMRQENWAAELAHRVYKAMVNQAVREGRLAIVAAPGSPRANRRLSPGFGPRPSHCSEILETAAP